MKKQINIIIEKLRSMGEKNGDAEFIDEIDNAIISLEAAHDRLVSMEESEEEDSEDEDSEDEDSEI